MWMAEYEVVQSFLRASNHKEQIKILSELNGCSTQDIIKILEKSPKIPENLLNKALGNAMKHDRSVSSKSSNNETEILKSELRKAYSLCMELEEENRRLQHEVILMLKDILVSVACR